MNMRNKDAVILKTASLFCFRLCSIMKKRARQSRTGTPEPGRTSRRDHVKYHLAIDIGASSGRHILGHVEKGCMMLEEIYRFDNIQVRKNGHDCWNTEQLWQSILEGLRACKAVNKVPETMGIDTWAVDFVLMGADGRPVRARTFFNADGTIMDAPGCHGGNNFSYIRAMRQIGEETGTPVRDLFSYSVELFEKIGHDNIHRYTSIKKGINKGKWPDDFLKELAKPDTVSENTHFNKDGAMLITEGLVELILKSKNPQLCELQSSLLHNVV